MRVDCQKEFLQASGVGIAEVFSNRKKDAILNIYFRKILIGVRRIGS